MIDKTVRQHKEEVSPRADLVVCSASGKLSPRDPHDTLQDDLDLVTLDRSRRPPCYPHRVNIKQKRGAVLVILAYRYHSSNVLTQIVLAFQVRKV